MKTVTNPNTNNNNETNNNIENRYKLFQGFIPRNKFEDSKNNINNNNSNRPGTGNFDNTNNSLKSSISSTNSKKRKPFENLSFSQTNIYNNIENNNNNIENNIKTENNKTEENPKEDPNNTYSNILIKSQSNFSNASVITEEEKSMILSSYKLISKETLEKAKKYNKQYKNTPFWIKFFEDIENDSLKETSSYYKNLNKSEFVKSLIEMVKKDADIYDKTMKNRAIREENENNIKSLIKEEISECNNFNESNISNESNYKNNKRDNYSVSSSSTNKKNNKSKISENSKNININPSNILNNNNNINDNNNNINNNNNNNSEIAQKLEKILNSYNKIDEKNKKIYNNDDEDYESFKFKLITGGKFNSSKVDDKEIIEKNIKHLENLEYIEENNEDNNKKRKEVKDNKKGKDDLLNNIIPSFCTIDSLKFSSDPFSPPEKDSADLFAFNPNSLPKLFELDKKLNEIDEKRYGPETYNILIGIRDEFNKGKEERKKKAEKEVREEFNKYQKEKETKRTIFDIKEKDETKIKYKDYLHSNDEYKKHFRDIEKQLKDCDNKIKYIYKQEISQSKKDEFNKELEKYHQSEEYKEKINNMILPEENMLNDLKKDIINFEENNTKLKSGLLEVKNLLIEEINKSKNELKEEQLKKFKEEIEIPFFSHVKEVNDLYEDNQNNKKRLEILEKENEQNEKEMEELEKKIEDLKKNKENYENIFEEADKILLKNEEENNNKDNIIEVKDSSYDKEELKKKYGIDQLLEEQKKNKENEKEYEDKLNKLKIKLNELKIENENFEKEMKEHKLLSPEEFSNIIPEEVRIYLEEKEKEEKENKINTENIHDIYDIENLEDFSDIKDININNNENIYVENIDNNIEITKENTEYKDNIENNNDEQNKYEEDSLDGD